MKQKIKKYFFNEIMNYTLILIGAVLIAFSYVLFLSPNKITAGGIGGVAVTLHHLFNIPMGLLIFAMNLPLFIIGVKFLGKMYGIRTMLGIFLVSFLVDLFDGKYVSFIKFEALEVDMIIAALFGGLLIGAGLGLMFRGKGSSGGTDIIAQILGRYTSFTPGMAFLFMDFFIITISGLLLGFLNHTEGSANYWELIFYGLITLYISSRVVDVVLQGISTSKSVQIISQKNVEIRNYIHKEMNRGATVIPAYGSYTNVTKEIIYVIITRKELTKLKEYISKLDSNAFMIVMDTHQVIGYGFRRLGGTV